MPRPPAVVGAANPSVSTHSPTTQGTGTQGKTRGQSARTTAERGSILTQEKGRSAAEISAEISQQKTQESSGSVGTPVNSGQKSLARKIATRRARRSRMAALRFTGGHRRQAGVQAETSTCSTATQTNISLPQRVDIVWQSHVLGPSAYVDSRAPDEDSDDGEHTDDNFEHERSAAHNDQWSTHCRIGLT